MAQSPQRFRGKSASESLAEPAPAALAGEGAPEVLERIAAALERLAPPPPPKPDFAGAEAFVWHPEGRRLAPVRRINRVDLSLLRGIDRVRDLLVENTERFARGLPANNALLWGARGMGKSSLVKAAHAAINREKGVAGRLKLVEIHREDIEGLPALMGLLREAPRPSMSDRKSTRLNSSHVEISYAVFC